MGPRKPLTKSQNKKIHANNNPSSGKIDSERQKLLEDIMKDSVEESRIVNEFNTGQIGVEQMRQQVEPIVNRRLETTNRYSESIKKEKKSD